MTRMTKKYIMALQDQQTTLGGREVWNDAADLYRKLQAAGRHWDAKAGVWCAAALPADAPVGARGLYRIRVNANPDEVDRLCAIIENALGLSYIDVVEKSDQYPNTRKGTGVRVYLTAQKRLR